MSDVKIDNLVHIAHNCKIRRGAYVIACAEISGGVEIGKNAWVAPNASVRQQLIIGEESVIGPDDVHIKAMVDGVLHPQRRSNKLAKTLAPRKVRVNVKERPSHYQPLVHYSVAQRFIQVTDYRPLALRNTQYAVLKEGGDIQSDLHGVYALDLYQRI